MATPTKNKGTSAIQESQQRDQQPRVGYYFYQFIRKSTIFIITISVMIPLIYFIGSEFTTLQNKPLYELYDKEEFYQSKLKKIEKTFKLDSKYLALNLHTNQTKYTQLQLNDGYEQSWENLLDFSSYIAYKFQEKGLRIITRYIGLQNLPNEPKGKKAKKAKETDNTRLIENLYQLDNYSETYILKRKINQVAQRIIKRLKIAPSDSSKLDRKNKLKKESLLEGQEWKEKIKRIVLNHVNTESIWIIVINNQNNHNISLDVLKREIAEIRKEREKDKFIIITQNSIEDPSNKIKNLEVQISQPNLFALKEKLFSKIKDQLSFVNSGSSRRIFCLNNGSLLDINNFLYVCSRINHNDCETWFKRLNLDQLKAAQKQEKAIGFSSSVKELCDKGKYKINLNLTLQFLYNEYGLDIEVNQNTQYLKWSNEGIKEAYQISNNVTCKSGGKRKDQCNLQWLSKDPQFAYRKREEEKKKKEQENLRLAEEALNKKEENKKANITSNIFSKDNKAEEIEEKPVETIVQQTQIEYPPILVNNSILDEVQPQESASEVTPNEAGLESTGDTHNPVHYQVQQPINIEVKNPSKNEEIISRANQQVKQQIQKLLETKEDQQPEIQNQSSDELAHSLSPTKQGEQDKEIQFSTNLPPNNDKISKDFIQDYNLIQKSKDSIDQDSKKDNEGQNSVTQQQKEANLQNLQNPDTQKQFHTDNSIDGEKDIESGKDQSQISEDHNQNAEKQGKEISQGLQETPQSQDNPEIVTEESKKQDQKQQEIL